MMNFALRKVLIICLFQYGCTEKLDSYDFKKYSQVINSVNEMSSKMLLTSSNEIIFSAYKNGFFNLFKYNLNTNFVTKLNNPGRDVIYPFLYRNKIGGLYDSGGSQNYQSTINSLNGLNNNRYFKWISSSSSGTYILYQIINSLELYLLNSKTNVVTTIGIVENNFNGFSFDEEEKHLVASYDDKLVYFDLLSSKRKIKEYNSPVMNPFIIRNTIYFSYNFATQFYNIYKVNINAFFKDPILCFKSEADVRMPKVKGIFLYYIKIHKSQYVLKKYNLESGKHSSITCNGVIYEYEILDDKIVASYSDTVTPRTLIIINELSNKYQSILGSQIHLGSSFKFIDKANLSPAYLFLPDSSIKIKGILIYIHGQNGDCSPRWETLLSTLCYSGYIVLSPNYPSSFGYGKDFFLDNKHNAIKDLYNWTNEVQKLYIGVPVHYISYSYGNVVMEELLNKYPIRVKSIISLFGLTNDGLFESEVPSIYILGKNDPFVEYVNRIDNLHLNGISDENIILLADEGHWLRKSHNYEEIFKKIYLFLNVN